MMLHAYLWLWLPFENWQFIELWEESRVPGITIRRTNTLQYLLQIRNQLRPRHLCCKAIVLSIYPPCCMYRVSIYGQQQEVLCVQDQVLHQVYTYWWLVLHSKEHLFSFAGLHPAAVMAIYSAQKWHLLLSFSILPTKSEVMVFAQTPYNHYVNLFRTPECSRLQRGSAGEAQSDYRLRHNDWRGFSQCPLPSYMTAIITNPERSFFLNLFLLDKGRSSFLGPFIMKCSHSHCHRRWIIALYVLNFFCWQKNFDNQCCLACAAGVKFEVWSVDMVCPSFSGTWSRRMMMSFLELCAVPNFQFLKWLWLQPVFWILQFFCPTSSQLV